MASGSTANDSVELADLERMAPSASVADCLQESSSKAQRSHAEVCLLMITGEAALIVYALFTIIFSKIYWEWLYTHLRTVSVQAHGKQCLVYQVSYQSMDARSSYVMF